MRGRGLKALALALALPALAGLLLWGVYGYFLATIPPYQNSLGYLNHTEKITGQHLLREAAAQGDNLIIFGSSELATFEIPTHPSNFFAGMRGGFQVNLIGRGSCQSIIHAIAIAASGDALADSRVVLITSPQSYTPQGIAPELFMANFSPQQYLALLADEDLSPQIKQAISARVVTLFARYAQTPGAAEVDPALRWLAEGYASPGWVAAARSGALSPYLAFARYLYNLRDLSSARQLLRIEHFGPPIHPPGPIDWEEEGRLALESARTMSGNNEFGFLNDYFSVNVGSHLHRFEGRDRHLDYSVSEEYDDLRLLFEVVNQKGLDPLFVHIPFHGQWSDFTGLEADARRVYYDRVREIAEAYGIRFLDLTGYEYEEFFLCDIVHLGWKGWLRVAGALVEFYYQD